jgi:transposase
MARAYGRAVRSRRVVGYVPKNWGESVTLIAGIRLGGVVAPMMLDGSMTGEILESYVEQFVVRELKPGDIVVWDNLGAHKRASVRSALEAVGAELLFLPAYSPDLNPIELAWSKLKTLLRARAARTPEQLESAVAQAFSAINAEDIQHWMEHCGYPQADSKLR